MGEKSSEWECLEFTTGFTKPKKEERSGGLGNLIPPAYDYMPPSTCRHLELLLYTTTRLYRHLLLRLSLDAALF
jgi:hypothetical protein